MIAVVEKELELQEPAQTMDELFERLSVYTERVVRLKLFYPDGLLHSTASGKLQWLRYDRSVGEGIEFSLGSPPIPVRTVNGNWTVEPPASITELSQVELSVLTDGQWRIIHGASVAPGN